MPGKFLKNTSISTKLYVTIGIMALLIIIELCVLAFALNTVSAIRGYVNGEALWSKAQRDASLQLRLYAYSGDEENHRNFLRYLQVPLGDRQERIALEKPVPDLPMARAGLLQGRNHPDDVDGMIDLLLRFGKNPYLARTIYYWKKAEASLLKFIPVAQQLHDAFQKGPITSAQRDVFIRQINAINQEITPYEDGFSYTLGEGSRWLEKLVMRILMAVALTVEITGILIAVSISRSIRRGLNTIIEVARQLAEGLLYERVKINSTDEIGELAAAFNNMADHLQRTIDQHKDSEIKLRSFFDSTHACHVLMDKDLKLVYYNQAVVNFSRKHYLQDAKQGMPVEDWVHPHRLQSFRLHCESALTGKAVHEDIKLTYASGETFWWSLNYESARDTDGKVIGVSYHAIDITRRVLQEQEIIAQNETLRNIAHIQSHELRRPVASILGLINVFRIEKWQINTEDILMLEAATLELDEEIKKIVNQIQEDHSKVDFSESVYK